MAMMEEDDSLGAIEKKNEEAKKDKIGARLEPERFQAPGLNNSMLDIIEGESNIIGGEMGFALPGDINVITEDCVIFNARRNFSNSVYLNDNSMLDIIDAKSKNLYVIMKYALESGRFINDNADKDFYYLITPENQGLLLDDEAIIRESKDPKNWSIQVEVYEQNSLAIQTLFTAVTNINLIDGTESNQERKVIDLIKEIHPEYYISWLIARVLNEKSKIVSKFKIENDKGSAFTVEQTTLWNMLTQDIFGLDGPAVRAVADLNKSSFTGQKARMLIYVLDRLHQYKLYFAKKGKGQTIFSETAYEIKGIFTKSVAKYDINIQLDAERNSYGNFYNRDAMLAFMLAANELSIIRSCASMVKTLMLKQTSAERDETKLLNVCGAMLGYNIVDIMNSPDSAQHAPIVYSRVSVENLGSLAAVWLGTRKRFTYEELLTAGHEATAPLVGYARVVPFVQAVLMHSASTQGGLSASANIQVADVVYVFQQIALVLVETTPGFRVPGTTKMLTDVDQQIVTTLFYGAMSSGSWVAENESTYLANILFPVGGQDKEEQRAKVELAPLDQNISI